MERTKIVNNRGTELINVPIQFHMWSVRLNWQIVRLGKDTLVAGSCFSGVTMENIDLGDGWELVRHFLSVTSEDEQSVLEFLMTRGRFDPPKGSITTTHVKPAQVPIHSVWRGDPTEIGHFPVELVSESFSLREFSMIQDYVRRMLTTGNPTLPTPWKMRDFERYEIAFAGARSGSQAHVLVRGTFPSILATIQFKLAQGARFRTCARKDCRLSFEVTSRHTRRFCTQYCAHITSLRQRRRAERKAKREEDDEK